MPERRPLTGPDCASRSMSPMVSEGAPQRRDSLGSVPRLVTRSKGRFFEAVSTGTKCVVAPATHPCQSDSTMRS